ncbi:9688_t:CDS:2, partial [Acaulospora morrowiae]
DAIDPVLLEVALDDLIEDLESGALEKLFPGPIINIDRGLGSNNQRMVMTVVLTRKRYPFDEYMGRIFIDVLNALVEDRKLEKNFDDNIYDSFFMLVVRLLNLIRDLVHLNELYECFDPGVVFSNSIGRMKGKYVENLTELEKALIDIGFEKFEGKARKLVKDRQQELTMIVREIDKNVEGAYRNLHVDMERWKKQKSTMSLLHIFSIFVAISFPVIDYYFLQGDFPFGNLMTIIGVTLSLLTSLWCGWLRNSYIRAINSHKKAIPVHAATAISIEALQRWLNRIS